MKNFLRSILLVPATGLLTIASQSAVLAESNGSQAASSDLSAAQVVGGVALLLFAILLPLVKSRSKIISAK